MYGLATYTAVYLVYQLLGRPFSAVEVSGTDKPTLMLGQFVDEILVSIPVSIVLATLWVAATSHKLLTRMLQRVGATKKYGDEDVWDFMFNSSNVAAKFVHFRDFDKMLVYAGYVQTFSESGKLRELVLRDVVIYDFSGKEVTKAPKIYLARDPSDIHIELPIGDNPSVGM